MGSTIEDRPAITPYLVEGKKNSAVIICPGGGYQIRADHEGAPVAEWFNRLGISAFVLRYRVAPYRYPAAKLDIQRAIRKIRYEADQYGVDPNKIGVLGFSAGGHLAATAGTLFDEGKSDAENEIDRLSSRPDLLMLCYPVITFQGPYAHVGSCKNLLGEHPEPHQIESLSLETRVTAHTPPTFLWHTSDDNSVPVEHSLMFASNLHKHNIPFDLHVYAKGRHGLGLAQHTEHVCSWLDALSSWIRYNGFGK